VQISLAPPIVSEASSFLTKLFSNFIFITEYAREIVTARGRPSGTATTITVMAMIRKPTRLFRESMCISYLVSSFTVTTIIFTVIEIKVRRAT
jgi:hypothetical protein